MGEAYTLFSTKNREPAFLQCLPVSNPFFQAPVFESSLWPVFFCLYKCNSINLHKGGTFGKGIKNKPSETADGNSAGILFLSFLLLQVIRDEPLELDLQQIETWKRTPNTELIICRSAVPERHHCIPLCFNQYFESTCV